jgi:SAM-dependent methyltransferase
VTKIKEGFPIAVDQKYMLKRPSSFYSNQPSVNAYDQGIWSKLAEKQIQEEAIPFNFLQSVAISSWLMEASRGGGVLVDYNCGTGLFSEALRQITGHKYMGFDRSDILIRGAKARWSDHPYLIFNSGHLNDPCVIRDAHIVWTYGVLSNCASEEDQNRTLQDIFNILGPYGNYICMERTLTAERLQREGFNAPLMLMDDFTESFCRTAEGWKWKFISYGFRVKNNFADMYWFIKA